ncbi:hypothetical protein CAter282_2714 [Collimonas arenae]|uniref:Uncharacterized protein n=1 Tax=Collimonas arenae TaxID=279058 RepID=A0A127PRY1_9BURK|nr:hypothetical protein [Collimonas arenae]AMP00561.1 hypothetical protein CAter10_2989 [Collimonas arenae]AMP10444.1 hypothetical protein CAter282_2714 [Collimonas arenae]
MFEFLLIVVGVVGIAISIFAKVMFACRSNASATEDCGEKRRRANAQLFSKPGRADPG